MSVLKFQQIRSCRQCGDILAKTCANCVKHPDRKPRVMEWYSWPKILKVCECTCSVLIHCQREGCPKTMWRNKKNSKAGLSRSETLYCSRACNCIVQNAAKKTRMTVPCAWCQKPVERKVSEVKNLKHAFCRPDHYHMFMAQKRHNEKEAMRIASRGTDGRSLLQCGKCKDVTEHSEINDADARCSGCSTIRRVAVLV